MDEYDQIQYRLWCEKKAREASLLSNYKIAESFGVEALEIIPKVNRILMRRLYPLRQAMIDLHDQARLQRWDQFNLSFLLKCAVTLTPLSKEIQLLQNNKIIFDLCCRRKNIKENPQKESSINIETINHAKEIPILSLYSFEKLKKLGNKIQTICPFHAEKTGSFFVYDNNSFHCFSCGENGSAIDFYMKLNNCDFKDAVKALIG